MFYEFGLTKILNIISGVCRIERKISSVDDAELMIKYKNFLVKHSAFEISKISNHIQIMDLKALESCIPQFYKQKNGFFKDNSETIADKLASGLFYEYLEQLKLENLELYEVANLIIKVILINQLQSYTNGTTEETIGLASFDFKDHFDHEDFMELVVHQLTHMILFLDNINNKHVIERNGKTMIEVGLNYKLGGTKFPAYICFHSYLVGAEVLSHRRYVKKISKSTSCHGDTARILRLSKFFENAIEQNMQLFTNYGQSLIKKAKVSIEKIKEELSYC